MMQHMSTLTIDEPINRSVLRNRVFEVINQNISGDTRECLNPTVALLFL